MREHPTNTSEGTSHPTDLREKGGRREREESDRVSFVFLLDPFVFLLVSPLFSSGSPFVSLRFPFAFDWFLPCFLLAPPSFFYWVPLWFPFVFYWLPLCSSIGIPSLSGVAGRYLLDLRRPPVNTTGGATPSKQYQRGGRVREGSGA